MSIFKGGKKREREEGERKGGPLFWDWKRRENITKKGHIPLGNFRVFFVCVCMHVVIFIVVITYQAISNSVEYYP